jgi:hypothetical protein
VTGAATRATVCVTGAAGGGGAGAGAGALGWADAVGPRHPRPAGGDERLGWVEGGDPGGVDAAGERDRQRAGPAPDIERRAPVGISATSSSAAAGAAP